MLKKVAVGDMVMYSVGEGDMVMYMNRDTPAFEGVAIVTKINLYGYPNVAQVEWLTGGKGRGSVNLKSCKVLS